jgi:hypothetical protein
LFYNIFILEDITDDGFRFFSGTNYFLSRFGIVSKKNIHKHLKRLLWALGWLSGREPPCTRYRREREGGRERPMK